jgi:hypothetical protein
LPEWPEGGYAQTGPVPHYFRKTAFRTKKRVDERPREYDTISITVVEKVARC